MIEKEEFKKELKAIEEWVNKNSFLGLTLKSNLRKVKLDSFFRLEDTRMLYEIIEDLYKELRNLKISILEKDLELKRLNTYYKLLDLEGFLLSEGHDIRYEELLLNLTNQKDDLSIFKIFDYLGEQCI